MSQFTKLVAELKRRRVFRVAALYAVVAWLVIQVATQTFPYLQLPDWTATLVIVLVLLGFPLALVLSWLLDVTPQGVVSAPEETTPIFAAPALTAETTDARSIAVLPFVNMSADPENEYFSDGITEELLHALAQVGELRVVARTSSFAFKGQNLDVREIGRKLGVGTVLEGSVRKSGGRIRLTAQLIKVEDGYHLWSKTYDRELEDVFAVQDEISRSIADALEITLVGGRDTPVVTAPTDNLEAYELYLKGRFHFHKWDEAALHKSIRFFEQALQKDPGYALAHAGMADSLVGLMNFVAPDETLPKAKAAAERALALDDGLAEPFVSIGMVKAFQDWDWAGAERAFRRAIELDPNHAAAHAFYIIPLIAQGRTNEALRSAEHSQRLDPLSPMTNGMRCVMLYYLRCFHESAARIAEFLEATDSDYPETRGYLGLAHIHKGEREKGLEILREAVERSESSLMALVYQARGHALSGNRDEALRLLDEIEPRVRDEYVSPSFIAAVHIALGNTAAALDYLERGYEKRDMELVFLRVHPDFEALKSEPRFIRLLEKVGLAEPAHQARTLQLK